LLIAGGLFIGELYWYLFIGEESLQIHGGRFSALSSAGMQESGIQETDYGYSRTSND
jgi:hypothetical protein